MVNYFICSIFPAVRKIEINDIGTKAANKPNNKGQLEICPAKSIARIVPKTAEAPPNPASEPTDLPQ